MILLLSGWEKFGEIGLMVTYAFIALAVLGMVLGILIATFQNLKKGGLVAIIGSVTLLVLFFIGYAMSTDVLPAGAEKYIDGSGYKLANGGLITCYILIVVAAVLSFLGLIKGLVTGN